MAENLKQRLVWHLVGIGTAAILVMFFDFLQYLAGYWATLSAYRATQSAGRAEGEYDETNIFYRLRKSFFYMKIVGVTATVIWLVSALGYWLVHAKLATSQVSL